MKHLKVFETTAAFDAAKDNIEKPYVALTEDDSKVHYTEQGGRPKLYADSWIIGPYSDSNSIISDNSLDFFLWSNGMGKDEYYNQLLGHNCIINNEYALSPVEYSPFMSPALGNGHKQLYISGTREPNKFKLAYIENNSLTITSISIDGVDYELVTTG